jgi:hypothetical protein
MTNVFDMGCLPAGVQHFWMGLLEGGAPSLREANVLWPCGTRVTCGCERTRYGGSKWDIQ